MDWLMIAYSALDISSINPGVIVVLCIGRDLSIVALYYYCCYYIGVPETNTFILYIYMFTTVEEKSDAHAAHSHKP